MFKKIISTITLTTKRIVKNVTISDITEFCKISDTIQIKKSFVKRNRSRESHDRSDLSRKH